MGFFEELRILGEQVKKRQVHIQGEEATKQALILPFLQTLGYDIYNPTEVQPEYIADFAKKKSSGQMEKVDYVIHLGGVPAIFIECKSLGSSLEHHSAQLARYFNATPSVKAGILTNGTQYQFFTDLQATNIMDTKPFFAFDILSFVEREAEEVRLFTKSAYDPNEIKSSAEEMIYVNTLTNLVGELLRSPSDNFIRFLLGEMELVAAKRVTGKVVERFAPVVRKAIRTTLLELATRSIRQETEERQLAVVTPLPTSSGAPQDTINQTKPSENSTKQIVTTEEELQGVASIKKICAESSWFATYPIEYKDCTNYMALFLQGSIRAWFLRLFCDSRKKAITTRISVEKATLLCPGFEVEEAPPVFGVSRVYIQTVNDLEKLRPLLLFSYEEEARRREEGVSSTTQPNNPAKVG